MSNNDLKSSIHIGPNLNINTEEAVNIQNEEKNSISLCDCSRQNSIVGIFSSTGGYIAGVFSDLVCITKTTSKPIAIMKIMSMLLLVSGVATAVTVSALPTKHAQSERNLTLTSDVGILVAGGYYSNETDDDLVLDSVELWSISSGQLYSCPRLPAPRYGHSQVQQDSPLKQGGGVL